MLSSSAVFRYTVNVVRLCKSEWFGEINLPLYPKTIDHAWIYYFQFFFSF